MEKPAPTPASLHRPAPATASYIQRLEEHYEDFEKAFRRRRSTYIIGSVVMALVGIIFNPHKARDHISSFIWRCQLYEWEKCQIWLQIQRDLVRMHIEFLECGAQYQHKNLVSLLKNFRAGLRLTNRLIRCEHEEIYILAIISKFRTEFEGSQAILKQCDALEGLLTCWTAGDTRRYLANKTHQTVTDIWEDQRQNLGDELVFRYEHLILCNIRKMVAEETSEYILTTGHKLPPVSWHNTFDIGNPNHIGWFISEGQFCDYTWWLGAKEIRGPWKVLANKHFMILEHRLCNMIFDHITKTMNLEDLIVDKGNKCSKEDFTAVALLSKLSNTR